MLLSFSWHPPEFRQILLEGPALQTCRDQMQELPCQLDSGALVFLEPFQYNVAIGAAMRHQGQLAVLHKLRGISGGMQVLQRVRRAKEQPIGGVPSGDLDRRRDLDRLVEEDKEDLMPFPEDEASA